MKIGVIGGTFDPIHNGHLIIAEYARTSLRFDKVIFMPSGIHPFKDNKGISESNLRIDMILLAIESNKYFEVSSLDIDRVGTTYTIDTIIELKDKYKDDELYFIFGSDIIFEIDKWKDIEKLSTLCKFVLLSRPGKNEEEINKRIESLKFSYNIHIEKVNSPMIEISSTEIRNRIKNKLSIKYLVPETLEKYILDHNLYS
ncbi:nicotinate-nucleotide adenylyltransferase [Tissierella sp.]|uniref:nicotinate-nucleotide adenylyltransferase n=1 Tax=Tissierella sp. TaxID=41274 RepID=UPI0028609564|nr:nicotinate-nucleotide adenylyltransferase [Tissierella sp.]MDR7857079.1 nicotinate-nucleotide adenylyltransferase [Tissierella sp.]